MISKSPFPQFKINKFPSFKPLRMGQIGEAEGGYGRFFGGVSRAELVKSAWFPVMPAPLGGGATLANIGFHTAVLLDGVGEYCSVSMNVPSGFTTIDFATVRVIGVPAVAIQNLRCDYDIGQDDEAYNTHTGNFVMQANLVPNQTDDMFVVYGGAGAGPLTRWDSVGLRFTYQAAGGGGNATNLYVLGCVLVWR